MEASRPLMRPGTEMLAPDWAETAVSLRLVVLPTKMVPPAEATRLGPEKFVTVNDPPETTGVPENVPVTRLPPFTFAPALPSRVDVVSVPGPVIVPPSVKLDALSVPESCKVQVKLRLETEPPLQVTTSLCEPAMVAVSRIQVGRRGGGFHPS